MAQPGGQQEVIEDSATPRGEDHLRTPFAGRKRESIASSSAAKGDWSRRGKKWGKKPHGLQPIPADLDFAKTA